jgi:hypothetical protein
MIPGFKHWALGDEAGLPQLVDRPRFPVNPVGRHWPEGPVYRKIRLMLVFDGYYYAIKAAFLFGLVHSFVKFETLQKSWLFLGLLYAAGVALLSWVWLVAPGRVETRPWQIWVGETAVIAVVYFKLLERFDEGPLFWMLLMAGLGVVYF